MRGRLLKVLAIVGFSLVAVLAVIASSSTADGYEISIYAAYPQWFWYGIVAGFVIGTAVIVGSVNVDNRRCYFVLGISMILLTNALLLFMPLIRGYFAFGGGDMYTHRGHVLDILETGHIASGNYYPGIHIQAVIGMDVTGLDFFTLKNVLTPAYSLVYWSGFLLFAHKLSGESSKLHYAVPFIFLPIFKSGEIYFGPNVVSFSFYPLLLYSLFSVWSSRNRYLTVVILVFSFVVFVHPVTTLLCLFTIVLISVSRLITTKAKERRITVKRSLPVLTMPIAIVIVFFSWYFSFIKILAMTINMMGSLFGSTGTTQIEEYSNTLALIPLDLIDLLTLVVYRRGTEIILSLLAITSVVYLMKRYRWDVDRIPWESLFAILSFGTFSAIAAMLLVNPIFLSWERIFKFSQFFAVLLVLLTIFMYIERADRERHTQILVTISLVVIVIMANLVVFGTYASTQQRSTSFHLPESRLEGMDWFMEHRNDDRSAYGFSYRYEHALLGVDPSPRSYTERQIPKHFGYHNASTFGGSNRSGSYLLITEKLEEYYPSLHPGYQSHWRYTPNDFQRLDRDETLMKVYSSGSVRVYKAKSN